MELSAAGILPDNPTMFRRSFLQILIMSQKTFHVDMQAPLGKFFASHIAHPPPYCELHFNFVQASPAAFCPYTCGMCWCDHFWHACRSNGGGVRRYSAQGTPQRTGVAAVLPGTPETDINFGSMICKKAETAQKSKKLACKRGGLDTARKRRAYLLSATFWLNCRPS